MVKIIKRLAVFNEGVCTYMCADGILVRRNIFCNKDVDFVENVKVFLKILLTRQIKSFPQSLSVMMRVMLIKCQVSRIS